MNAGGTAGTGDGSTSPLIRVLFGLLLVVYVVVMGLFKLLAGIFGFWVIFGINVGIILGAYWLNPTFGMVVTYLVFGYWALWVLLKLIQLVVGKRLEQALAARLDTIFAKEGRS